MRCCTCLASFNSSMVQLKVIETACIDEQLLCFNSSMVQLKVVAICGFKFLGLFQFLYGTIKRRHVVDELHL